MTKFVLIALLAVFATASARGITGETNNIKNNEIVPVDKESRVLLEVPLIGMLIYKSFNIIWFLLSSLCSVIDYKLAALALAFHVGYSLLGSCYPLIIGAALIFGFCKITGLCGFDYAYDDTDHLTYAANHLYYGTEKYGNGF